MVEVTQEDRGAVRAFHAKALGLAISGNEANRLLTEAFARHRIAAENAAQQEITALDAARGKAEPVAWMYIRKPEEWPPANPVVGLNKWKYDDPARPYWIETPLYAHPPAPDAARGDPVAQVVEWLRELSGDEPLPPGCTKGEVWVLRRAADAIESGEPFNAD